MTSLLATTRAAHGRAVCTPEAVKPNDLIIKHIGECEAPGCNLSNISVAWWNEINDFACDACRNGER